MKRRRLSAALKQLRLEANLEPKEVAQRLGWDVTKIHRMERNQWTRPNARDIRDLLELFGVTDERQREALLALARESSQRGWWADYADVFRSSLPDFESGAAIIRTYEALLVPGLLQTADYMRAVFHAGASFDEATIERQVEARLTRQEVLRRSSPPHLWAVIDEAALRKQVGGGPVMRAQIEHIIAASELANVAVQVLRDSAGAHTAMTGGFVILDFAEMDPSIVCIETATDSLYLEKPEELHRYTVIYSHVQALA
ncbi:helix-turn-helix domain-containing protein, partial [Nonomuraea sp. MTCD27]|uniref:helix-turn-helix domain-containing protein n=1 Tax=Nonomuraea sp. MTCD27 TaxID=1676747 RepID=UPI0035C23F32